MVEVVPLLQQALQLHEAIPSATEGSAEEFSKEAQIPILIAALHPKMLDLAASKPMASILFRPAGAYRQGPCANRLASLALCGAGGHLEADAAKARAAARQFMSLYIPNLPNYVSNLRALGIRMRTSKTDAAIAGGRDRRLGTEGKIRERIQAHLAAELRTCVSRPCARQPVIVLPIFARSRRSPRQLIAVVNLACRRSALLAACATTQQAAGLVPARSARRVWHWGDAENAMRSGRSC